ncbi:hypothetical protein TSAR_006084 [Trichomalopsis sarcophagae]|uniref:Uncharacterized protein n=1 Tax=Trichomalopsis sarcophagae TaxID=543379 RepID=A0A232EFN5_9HYME|nr:hypothetical protein TSAR_006084 [Trichomalopsis sarcophagae]
MYTQSCSWKSPSKEALEQHHQNPQYSPTNTTTTMPYSPQFVQLNNDMSIDDDDDEILFSTFDLEYYNRVLKMTVGVSNDETNDYDEILKSLPTPSAPEPCSSSKSESSPNPSVPITPSCITPALSFPILYDALTNPLTKSSPTNIPLPNNNNKNELLIAGCSPLSSSSDFSDVENEDKFLGAAFLCLVGSSHTGVITIS